MAQSEGWELERYRPLLRLQARQMQLDPRLQRRFDNSDLVQEALLKAHQGLAAFRGNSEAELVKWLQTILTNVLADEVDRAHAQKRDVALDQSLQAVLADSSARLDAYLAAREASPSQQAERQETLLRLAAAIDQLPDDQRDVIIHHHLLGTPVARIAEELGRTEKAVAGLLYRGKRRLSELLHDLE
jgi:RNA polymerase sigma-70 factor (ECF subfamily)